MTIELALALTSTDTYQPYDYKKAPRMKEQVKEMRKELPKWFDADARMVLEYLKR